MKIQLTAFLTASLAAIILAMPQQVAAQATKLHERITSQGETVQTQAGLELDVQVGGDGAPTESLD